MKIIALAVAISLVAGFAVGAWVGGDEPTAAGPAGATSLGDLPTDASTADRLARLEQVLADERNARIALEDTLAMLFDEIERLEGQDARAEEAQRAQAEIEARAAREARANERRSSRSRADMLRLYEDSRVARLIDGGFAEDEARRILQLESEASFKALQAAWEAQRSGESLSPLGATGNSQSILRSEIGDDAYARYLEAQGQPTAIEVTQVLDGSPGGRAGLLPGDQIVRYNGERLFNVVDLRNLTMQGNPGEDVVIEINRDGTRMQLTLPRGPVGITGSGASVRGLNWWGG